MTSWFVRKSGDRRSGDAWLGKNIGGTLGPSFEGSRELHDVSFYVQKNLDGDPEPNDDLDIQLLWLTLAEYYGVYRLMPRLMGEYFLSAVTGPWNEYGVCHWNCQSGFYPPLSGAVDNDEWKWSNGAWIRSEIWACLFPGDPDRAAQFSGTTQRREGRSPKNAPSVSRSTGRRIRILPCSTGAW